MRKTWLPPIAVALAAACATPDRVAVDSRAAAEPVIAAERAFAARHQQVTVKRSFIEYAAPDGVMVTPGGVRNAREYVGTWPDDDDTGLIVWWPSFAGIARSGELGFTTGPASYGGGKTYTNYFTVWKQQPDGSWKWAIDIGTRKGAKPAGGPGDPVAVVPVSTLPPMAAGRAWAELRALDERLGEESSRGASAFAPYFATEAQSIGWEEAPLVGAEAIAASLAKRPAMAMKPEGGGVSEAGDLGWTYGYASWTEGGQAKRGPYLRVWQRRREGWRILVDNVHAF
jgi:ketosteroid isomerase-like protein